MQQTFQCYRCGAHNYTGQQSCWNCGQLFHWQQQPPLNYQQQQWNYQQQVPRNNQQQNLETSDYTGEAKNGVGWFQTHLNWTYLLWISLIYACGVMIGIYIYNANTANTPIYAGGIWRWAIIPLVIFHIYANIWIIKRKSRSIWWFLPSVIFSPILLLLKNKSDEIGKTHLEMYLDKHGNNVNLDEIRAMVARQKELDELDMR